LRIPIRKTACPIADAFPDVPVSRFSPLPLRDAVPSRPFGEGAGIAMTDALRELWWPLTRLLMGLALGQLVAYLLEAMRWTRPLGRIGAPLARAAHLGEAAGAAFALTFVSPAAANSLLAQRHEAGRMSMRELVLANLFNGLPAYIVHTPTIFLLVWGALGSPAFTYVGLTLVAAAGRTAFTILLARRLLPAPPPGDEALPETDAVPPGEAVRRAWRRFLGRLPRLVCFTVPMYLLMYALQHMGAFAALEAWLGGTGGWLAAVKPQAIGIVLLHLAAEFGAALGAAGGAMATGALTSQEIVLALMVGNILSTPMRAMRHQFPAYAGIFRPGPALRLLLANQALRAISMCVMTAIYYALCG
jgi:hypothetical protein